MRVNTGVDNLFELGSLLILYVTGLTLMLLFNEFYANISGVLLRSAQITTVVLVPSTDQTVVAFFSSYMQTNRAIEELPLQVF